MIKVVAFALTGWLLFLGTILLAIKAPTGPRYYDCSIAEFHPDYPPKVREECRKQRMNQKRLTV